MRDSARKRHLKRFFRDFYRERDKAEGQFKLPKIKIKNTQNKGAHEGDVKFALRSLTRRVPELASLEDASSVRTLLSEGKLLRQEFHLSDLQLLSLLVTRSSGELAKMLSKALGRQTSITDVYSDAQLDMEEPDAISISKKIASFKDTSGGIRSFLRNLTSLVRDASEFKHPQDKTPYEVDLFKARVMCVLPEAIARKVMKQIGAEKSLVRLKEGILRFEKEIDEEMMGSETKKPKEKPKESVRIEELRKAIENMSNENKRLKSYLGEDYVSYADGGEPEVKALPPPED